MPATISRTRASIAGSAAMALSTCGQSVGASFAAAAASGRSEEHTSELQSLMRTSYAVFCLKKKKPQPNAQYIKRSLLHNIHTTNTSDRNNRMHDVKHYSTRRQDTT